MRFGASIVSVGLVALVAGAPGARAEDKAAARAAYAEGTKYYDLNKFEEALKAFEKAYWNYEEPAFLFNIAQCYRQLDRKPDAVKFYRSYLRKVPDASNRAEVERLIASLDAAIARERPASRPTEEAAPTPGPPATSAVASSPTAGLAEIVKSPAPSSAHSRRALKISGLTIGGIGLAAAGVGVAFAVLAKNANRDFLQPSDGVYSPAAESNRSTYQAAEIATFSVAGAALVAGTTMYLVGRRR